MRCIAATVAALLAAVALTGCNTETILPGPTANRPANVIAGDVVWSTGSKPTCEVEWSGQSNRFTYVSRCWNLGPRSQIMRVQCADRTILTGLWRTEGRWSVPPLCPVGSPIWWGVEVSPQ